MQPLRPGTLMIAVLLTVGSLGGFLSASAAGPSLAKPFVLVALGDSFTRAAEPVVGDQPEQSWATGSHPQVHSILDRVKAVRPDARGINAAASGARVEDLPRQVAAAPPGADLVLILIGINDQCWPTRLDAFAEHVRRGFEAVHAAHPAADVLVYAVPDLLDLVEINAHNPSALLFRSAFPYCHHVFVPPIHPIANSLLGARLQQYNEILRAEAVASGFRFSDAIRNLQFAPAELNGQDFFHPTLPGQAHLARAAWPDASDSLIPGPTATSALPRLAPPRFVTL